MQTVIRFGQNNVYVDGLTVTLLLPNISKNYSNKIKHPRQKIENLFMRMRRRR
jgi:hypothetical protein